MPIRAFFAAILLTLCSQVAFSQTFYDLDSIQTIEIQFDQSNWDYLLDTAKQGTEETYLIARWVKINGEQFDSVGVKYKGNSSYSANNAKNPMHLELNHVKGKQDYQGFTDVKLGNCYSDPSFVREPLSYLLLRNYMDAPRANFAKVYINGTYYGVYNNAEAINKDWADEHNWDKGHAIVKCNPNMVGGPGGSGTGSNLAYISTDSTAYYSKYEIKSGPGGWAELIHLCDTLNNKPAALDRILDVDKAIWMLAFNNVAVNLDSYTGQFRQNYYLFRDKNSRFASVVWDLNMCLGGFPGGGSLSSQQQLSLDLHSTDAGWPLIKQVFANPTWKRMYYAHARTFFNEAFVSGLYISEAEALMSSIAADVQADTKKTYTYAQFQNSLDQTASGGGPGGGTPGIRQLMAARISFLQNTAPFKAVPPALSGIAANPAAPAIGADVFLTASAPGAVYLRLGWRETTDDRFEYVAMLDDGAHGDGAAGDGVFGAKLTMTAPAIQYFVYAENADAGIFSPERAEHEFHVLVGAIPALQAGDVVINEFMPSNKTAAADQDGEHDDWLELYNTTNHEVDLSGAYLSDNPQNPAKWAFPAGTTIGAGKYLVVWADEDGSQTGLHASFKLSNNGETLVFSDASGFAKVDEIEYFNAVDDVSFARCPNGTGDFKYVQPTFLAANTCISGTGEAPTAAAIALFPNPAAGEIRVESSAAIGAAQVFDWSGKLCRSAQAGAGETALRMDVSDLPAGIYVLRTAAGAAVKFVKN